MAHIMYKENWVMIGGILLGTLLTIIVLEIATAYAGLNGSTDANSQCAWGKTATSQIQATPALAPEPGEELLIDEDVNIVTGLYTRYYSRQENGTIDYKTARQIITSEYNEYWNTVVHTKEFPLFYWEDSNQDGRYNMWVDQQGDGLPCDIIPYQLYENPQETQLAGYE